MTHSELLSIVASSVEEDWNLIHSDIGSTYIYKLDFYNGLEEQKNVIIVDSHSTIAIYKNDLSITMAWGMKDDVPFTESYLESFSDKNAVRLYLDFFYNGVLVNRLPYIDVDGHRASLPIGLPSNGKFYVEKIKNDIIKLVHNLDHGSAGYQYDDYFKRAGFILK
jgi:hypothetical protein